MNDVSKKAREFSVTAMILAAGKGTRMRPLTDRCPKPLLPVAGTPLIERHLQKLKVAGVKHVVINCSYLADEIFKYFDQRDDDGLAIELISEGEEPFETAGGIANALDALGDMPFLVINGDVWCEIDYNDLVNRARSLTESNSDGELILVENPSHNLKGDFSVCSDSGNVLNRSIPGPTFTFSGLSIFKPELFHSLTNASGALGPFLRQWSDEYRLSASLFSGYWLDVGTPERLAELELRIRG